MVEVLVRRAVLALVMVAAACQHAANPDGAAAPVPATTVRVENQNFVDMDVFVVQHGMRMRLGRAPSLKTEVFTIPSSFVTRTTELQFDLRPIGSGGTMAPSPRTQTILVQPGDQVVLMIPPS